METKFNVFEILQIAEQIDHKEAKFYLKAAESFGDPEIRDFYYRLAAWKAKHERLWARARRRFSERTGEFGTFDPDDYVLSNPPVMAGLTWLGTRHGETDEFSGRESRRQVIRDAIRRTNEVIIFYRGLKDFARGPASADAVQRIIREQERQARLLGEELDKAQLAAPAGGSASPEDAKTR